MPREASTVSSLLSLSGLTRASPPHEDVVTATPSLPRPAFPEPSAGFGLAAGHQVSQEDAALGCTQHGRAEETVAPERGSGRQEEGRVPRWLSRVAPSGHSSEQTR